MSNTIEETHYFEPVAKLPAELEPTSLQVVKFVDRFKKTSDPKSFDWPRFKSAIDSYNGTDLTFDSASHTNFSHSETTVKAMVEKIAKYLLASFSTPVNAEFAAQLTATIETTFTHLTVAKSNDWANFTKLNETRSSWEYRVIFAIPIPESTEFFHSLVTTIKLEADIKEESTWFGLIGSTSMNFSAAVETIQLVVKKGFINPN